MNQQEWSLPISVKHLIHHIAKLFHFLKKLFSVNRLISSTKPVRLDKHDGLFGSILGSSMGNNTPRKLGKSVRP